MGEIFTFLGLINHSHGFIIGAHIVLVGIIVLGLAVELLIIEEFVISCNLLLIAFRARFELLLIRFD